MLQWSTLLTGHQERYTACKAPLKTLSNRLLVYINGQIDRLTEGKKSHFSIRNPQGVHRETFKKPGLMANKNIEIKMSVVLAISTQ